MPTDDAFFNRTGLERVGVVGSEPGCCWTSLQALALYASAKIKKEEGPTGASPVAAPMPKSVPPL